VVTAERLASQLLAGPPAGDPEAVAERLLAVQAQDPHGARLAIRARTRGLTAADVDRALTERRTLVVTWLNRGTLHLVRSVDYPWLQALTTPQLRVANARRLAQEGVSDAAADRAVGVIGSRLADEGPLTRPELRDRLASAGVVTAGQALVHLLMLACLRGIAVRGPMAGREQAYVLVRDWLGEQPAVDRAAALAELARRYLAGHAPANDRDLAKWAGLTLRDARAALAAVAATLRSRPDGLLEPARRPEQPPPPPPPRLLGQFEPLLLGWASRAEILAGHTPLVVSGGLFRPFALVEGRAAAVWRLRAGAVEVEPFHPLPRTVAGALDRDADDVTRFLSTA
jgi:hypothetical protein